MPRAVSASKAGLPSTLSVDGDKDKTVHSFQELYGLHDELRNAISELLTPELDVYNETKLARVNAANTSVSSYLRALAKKRKGSKQ